MAHELTFDPANPNQIPYIIIDIWLRWIIFLGYPVPLEHWYSHGLGQTQVTPLSNKHKTYPKVAACSCYKCYSGLRGSLALAPQDVFDLGVHY